MKNWCLTLTSARAVPLVSHVDSSRTETAVLTCNPEDPFSHTWASNCEALGLSLAMKMKAPLLEGERFRGSCYILCLFGSFSHPLKSKCSCGYRWCS
jgi:hypothetical protein